MKNLDFNRFWQVLKWTVISEKKSILTAAVAFTIGFLAIQLFSCFTIFDLSHGLGVGATYAGTATCGAILSLMTFYYASGILGNARTSQERTTALMLPASNTEKFAARIIYCCILMPLLLIVAFYAATCLRMLFELIAGHDNIISGFIFVFGNHITINDHAVNLFSTFFDIATNCWCISLFVLGGVLFRQRPFVWTVVTIVLVSIVLATLSLYVRMMIGEHNVRDFFMNFKGMTLGTFDFIVSLVFTAFTVLNVWLSYRLYKHLQVVQHKWFNV